MSDIRSVAWGSGHHAFRFRDSTGRYAYPKPTRADKYGFVILNIPNDQVRQNATWVILNAQNTVFSKSEFQILPTSGSCPLFSAEANCSRNELHGRQGLRQVFHVCVDGCYLRIRGILTLGHYRVFGRFCSTSSLLGGRRLLGVVCGYRHRRTCVSAMLSIF